MGEEADFEKYLAEHDAENRELLAKYKPGQKVKVNMGDGEVAVCVIQHIYTDYNGGPIQDVFVDVEDEDRGVIERVLAENILEIIEDLHTQEDVEKGDEAVEENGPIKRHDWPDDEDLPF